MPIDIGDESLGTVVWLGLIGPLLDALDDGSVLRADELNASLPPGLVRDVVQLIQDPETNPHRAQLVCNAFVRWSSPSTSPTTVLVDARSSKDGRPHTATDRSGRPVVFAAGPEDRIVNLVRAAGLAVRLAPVRSHQRRS